MKIRKWTYFITLNYWDHDYDYCLSLWISVYRSIGTKVFALPIIFYVIQIFNFLYSSSHFRSYFPILLVSVPCAFQMKWIEQKFTMIINKNWMNKRHSSNGLFEQVLLLLAYFWLYSHSQSHSLLSSVLQHFDSTVIESFVFSKPTIWRSTFSIFFFVWVCELPIRMFVCYIRIESFIQHTFSICLYLVSLFVHCIVPYRNPFNVCSSFSPFLPFSPFNTELIFFFIVLCGRYVRYHLLLVYCLFCSLTNEPNLK